MMNNLTICKDMDALGKTAARTFARLADQCVTKKGRFTVALSGGSTPRSLYTHLTLPPFRNTIPWGGVHIFWGDERMVPPDHPESNFGLANTLLLPNVPIPDENIFAMPMKDINPDAAAKIYEDAIFECFDPDEDEIPVFDLILLGIGADGHTASLFPGTSALDEKEAWVVANHIPFLNKTRLTLTFPLINQAKNILFLAAGKDKAPVIRTLLSEHPERSAYPAAGVQPAAGERHFIIDQDAASELPSNCRD